MTSKEELEIGAMGYFFLIISKLHFKKLFCILAYLKKGKKNFRFFFYKIVYQSTQTYVLEEFILYVIAVMLKRNSGICYTLTFLEHNSVKYNIIALCSGRIHVFFKCPP